MKSLILASTREGAGKTSMAIGLAGAVNRRFGYVKPLGDRFRYRKKRLWDRDAALFINLLDLGVKPESTSLGFDHSKLRYSFDRDGTITALRESVEGASGGRDAVLIECGKNLSYGSSVFLDPLTISQQTGDPVVIIASGSEDAIADDLAFVERFVGTDEANVAGVIINKVVHLDAFRSSHLPEIEKLGVRVFGVVPYQEELTTLSVSTVSEELSARILAGEAGLSGTIRTVAVGAMSVGAAMSEPLITAPDKLVITSGDRSDMILAAIDAGGTSAIVLTNNIVPPANIVSRAGEIGIPLLLVPDDTYAVALQVERIEPVLSSEDGAKLGLLRELVAAHVDVQAIENLI
ncbi:MAG: DRTGG domain-containing protein [Candidatus Bipolaricaulia bacterium]